MPNLTLTTPPGALPASAVQPLLQQLCGIVLAAEGVPSTPYFRANTWAWHHEAMLYSDDGHPRYLLQATVPRDALTPSGAADLIKGATEAIASAANLPASEWRRVWVHIHLLEAGSWGAAGQVVDFDRLFAAVAAAAREYG